MLTQYEGIGNNKVTSVILKHPNVKFNNIRKDNKFKAFAWLFFLHYNCCLVVRNYQESKRFFNLNDWEDFYKYIKF